MISTSQALSGNGAPTKNTVGSIDDIYVDLNTGTKYKCTSIFSYTGHNSLTVEYVCMEERFQYRSSRTDGRNSLNRHYIKNRLYAFSK